MQIYNWELFVHEVDNSMANKKHNDNIDFALWGEFMRKALTFIEGGFERIRKRLLEDLCLLSVDELNFVASPGLHSPIRLFLHVIQVEEFWLKSTLLAEPFELGIAVDWKDPSIDLVLEPLIKYSIEVRERFMDYLQSLTDEDLENRVEMEDTGKKEQVGWVLYHILEHECIHAGQVRMIAKFAGKELPFGPLLFNR
jgi:uncharacterized damage-inducible protein DinB